MAELYQKWNDFWLAPTSAQTLGAIRLVLGFAIFYNFLSYSEHLEAWFGSQSIVQTPMRFMSARFPYNWSYLWLSNNIVVLYGTYILALVASFAFALGLKVSISGPLTLVLYLMFINRNEQILFGFDEVCIPLLVFLIIGQCGNTFVLFRKPNLEVASRNRLSLRLIQFHMCFVYFGAGFGKLYHGWGQSPEAIWVALTMTSISNVDVSIYQYIPSFILTGSAIVMVGWELLFSVGIWNKHTHRLFLGFGVAMHVGIALTMTLASFSVVMMAGLLSFYPFRTSIQPPKIPSM